MESFDTDCGDHMIEPGEIITYENPPRIPSVDYLNEKRKRLEFLANQWKTMFIKDKEDTNPLVIKMKETGKPNTVMDIDSNGKVFATVKCELCEKNVRLDLTKSKSGSFGVRGGNYIKHLKRHFFNYNKKK